MASIASAQIRKPEPDRCFVRFGGWIMKACTRSVIALGILLGIALTGHGQAGMPSPQGDRSPFGSQTGPNRNRDHDEINSRMEQQQAITRNSERQKKLVDDTMKLLSLATELKTEVDKTDKNTLSLDVIKKADEIEKLAHSVKERMKG